MSEAGPRIVILAGPNGAGKSTSASRLLKGSRQVGTFVNADTIATGLSAFDTEQVAFAAGRIMLKRIRELARQRESFAFETTLSTRTYLDWLKASQEAGYSIDLIFLWLSAPQLAVERVRDRVLLGGHSVPDDVIKRRFYRGLRNFFELYQSISSRWWMYDNSDESPELVARGRHQNVTLVRDPDVWQQILNALDKNHG
jgi:predicted ABC-type ATPase